MNLFILCNNHLGPQKFAIGSLEMFIQTATQSTRKVASPNAPSHDAISAVSCHRALTPRAIVMSQQLLLHFIIISFSFFGRFQHVLLPLMMLLCWLLFVTTSISFTVKEREQGMEEVPYCISI
jgi:hypothetical protein